MTLLKALYSFSGNYSDCLSFVEGSLFHTLSFSQGRISNDWIYVIDSSGSTGFIPLNYTIGSEDSSYFFSSLETASEKGSFEQQSKIKGLLANLRQKRKRLPKEAPEPPSRPPKVNITDLAVSLVEKTEASSGLSYSQTVETLKFVINFLFEENISPSHLMELNEQLKIVSKYSSQEYIKMESLFEDLIRVKEDEEQRNWTLIEDEKLIIGLLEELMSELNKADPSLSRLLVSKYKYYYVSSLVEYFQMEIRWRLRKSLMETFVFLCSLDTVVISLMLSSVLPLELGQDLMRSDEHLERLQHSSLLLTILFSTGESLPIQYFDSLGSEFIKFLLVGIEANNEDLSDNYLALLLSYNLQFPRGSENITMSVLWENGHARIFSEKLLLLLNRDEDPTNILGNVQDRISGPVKCILDIFYHSDLHSLFYTNDILVLLDIIVRQLTDLDSEDNNRSLFVDLISLILPKIDYSSHNHRIEDYKVVFLRILHENSEDREKIIKLISKIESFHSLLS